jgi:O-antigen ligase
MALVLALVIALIPLAIAPGLLFYYDVTPKIAVLLLGTAAACIWWAATDAASGFTRSSRAARWFTIGMLAMGASVALSTVFSVNRPLSVGGSNWRRFGLITQLAALAFAWMAAACCAGRVDRVRMMLRAIAVAGLLTSLYGSAQYFGWDPLLSAELYHAGEGPFTIVRPPSTLGHADYFGGWLVCAVFGSAALAWSDKAPLWRWLAWAAVAAACAAVILSGTRGALLGVVAGAMLLAWWRGVRLTRRLGLAAGAIVAAAALFYVSPAGARLRARVHWVLQEPAGGARLWIWRDTLRMAALRAPAGYGPETFIGTFALHQSSTLAAAYPDFYSESPHNIFLDVLAGQGLPGLLISAGLWALGFLAAWQVRRTYPPGTRREIAGALAAALLGMLTAGQFVSFTLPTALPFYLAIALLVALTAPARKGQAAEGAGLLWKMAVAIPFAAVLALFAARLLVSGWALERARHDLDEKRVGDAVAQYDRYEDWRWPGGSADLGYSRRLLKVAEESSDPAIRLRAVYQARLAAERATRTVEDPFNAWCNLAAFYARQNDFARTEHALRSAVACAPNWFKPHWMLAKLLVAAGRPKEAAEEAALAVKLDGGHHAEVTRTFEAIRARLSADRQQR